MTGHLMHDGTNGVQRIRNAQVSTIALLGSGNSWSLLRIIVLVGALAAFFWLHHSVPVEGETLRFNDTELRVLVMFTFGLIAVEFFLSTLMGRRSAEKDEREFDIQRLAAFVSSGWPLLRIPAALIFLWLLMQGNQSEVSRPEILVFAEFAMVLLGFEGVEGRVKQNRMPQASHRSPGRKRRERRRETFRTTTCTGPFSNF